MKTKNKQKNKIPDGWEVKKLGTLFDIKRGGSPRPIDKFITENKDGLNWLKIGDIDKNAKFINSTSSKIKKEGLKKTTLVKKGDFILSNSMSFGRPYILNIDTCIHDGWLTFQNIKGDLLDRNFLYFLLLHPKTQNEFKNISAGSGVQNLKKETVSEVMLDFPPLAEQKRIVSVLEIWDEILEKLKRKIEIKKNIKKGLMQELLTGERRIDGFGGEWKNFEFNSCFKVLNKPSGIKSQNYEISGFPVIDQSDNKFISGYTTDKEKVYKYSPSNSVILFGDHSRTLKYIKENVAFGNDGIKLFQAKEDFDNTFLYFRLLIQKVPNTGYNRHFKYLKDEIFKLPSLEEQKAIADILMSADEELEELLRKQKLLEDQKKFLLNNLISGEIRTPENLLDLVTS